MFWDNFWVLPFLVENLTFSFLFLLNSPNNAKRKEVKGRLYDTGISVWILTFLGCMGIDVNFPLPLQVHIDVTDWVQVSVCEPYDLTGNYWKPGNLLWKVTLCLIWLPWLRFHQAELFCSRSSLARLAQYSLWVHIFPLGRQLSLK